MKIGITYDTKEDYENVDYSKYCDFASLTSISFLKKQFEQAGFEVQLIGSYKKLSELIKIDKLNVDLIYNTAEGISSRNREGLIPALLEANKIPYIGSDSYALSLTLNKYHTKLLAQNNHIPTPVAELFYRYDTKENIALKLQKLHTPVIVKPNYEGSSMGLFYAETVDDAFNYIKQDLEIYNQEILCEEYIDGMEITVPVIGNNEYAKALGCIEFYRSDGRPIFLFESDDKHYRDIRCREAVIPNEIATRLKEYSVLLHRFIGCKDINRVDFRLTSDNHIYFLEMNPLPALDPDGSFVCAARLQGMDFPKILKQIVQYAKERYTQ
jgi:D-alanine-D-alanine ligase